ncbi:GDP-mannose-dependent alpha-(1-6)-phosphatidylinositol dimannoside mannosyltransferase [Paraconexibacter sp. AEG42_29]|uniref:GDP-mannose-dependent alpha-(1-6)-phosphatidylinositol dimannoside mannosyltransferase n=2 Tax=Paraconexibacter sp. AEG42_29 TaxID=2997339 RepID=A0AAU7AT38_9ACTN
MFYGERSGGIRTYLDAKIADHARTGAYEHHVITPGAVESHEGGRHVLPGLRVRRANGYRLPLGVRRLHRTLLDIRPEVVLLHDPFWGPRGVAATAQSIDARTVAVCHGSSELDARGIPGPHGLYAPLLRLWLRRAYSRVDALMSVVDPLADCGRTANIPLRLGLHDAFRPQPDVPRGEDTVFVGRLARQKGVFTLLEAAATPGATWTLRFVGSGPAQDALQARAARLGIADRVRFEEFVTDRHALAKVYAGARCVVMPGEHETFGLVGLEAAASGARTVCCNTAPSGAAVGELAHVFAPGDVAGLAEAIGYARAAAPDYDAAAALAVRYAWPRLFADELAAMRHLAG